MLSLRSSWFSSRNSRFLFLGRKDPLLIGLFLLYSLFQRCQDAPLPPAAERIAPFHNSILIPLCAPHSFISLFYYIGNIKEKRIRADKAFVKMAVDKSVKKGKDSKMFFTQLKNLIYIKTYPHVCIVFHTFPQNTYFSHFQWISLFLYTTDFQRFNYDFLLSTHMVG